MSNGNEALGKASLWSSIIGIVVPGCLAVLVAVFIKNLYEQRMPYVICGVLFVVLELVALGCGISAKRTGPGKAGLIVSTTLLLLPVLCAAVIFFSWSADKPAMGDRPRPLIRPANEPKVPPVEGAK